MTEAPEYLRARDVARLTGMSVRTARRWIAKRIVASGKVGGARLVARTELERLLSPPVHLIISSRRKLIAQNQSAASFRESNM
jgi:excisionase family DNA binding protein